MTRCDPAESPCPAGPLGVHRLLTFSRPCEIASSLGPNIARATDLHCPWQCVAIGMARAPRSQPCHATVEPAFLPARRADHLPLPLRARPAHRLDRDRRHRLRIREDRHRSPPCLRAPAGVADRQLLERSGRRAAARAHDVRSHRRLLRDAPRRPDGGSVAADDRRGERRRRDHPDPRVPLSRPSHGPARPRRGRRRAGGRRRARRRAPGARARDRGADVRPPARGRGDGAPPLVPLRAGDRLRRRKPRNAHGRRPAQSGSHPRARRADRLDRRAGTFDGIFVTGILAVLLA